MERDDIAGTSRWKDTGTIPARINGGGFGAESAPIEGRLNKTCIH
jgi:hypothetical protein